MIFFFSVETSDVIKTSWTDAKTLQRLGPRQTILRLDKGMASVVVVPIGCRHIHCFVFFLISSIGRGAFANDAAPRSTSPKSVKTETKSEWEKLSALVWVRAATLPCFNYTTYTLYWLKRKLGLFFHSPPVYIMRRPILILLPNDIMPKSERVTSHAQLLLRGSVTHGWRTNAGFSSHLHDSERERKKKTDPTASVPLSCSVATLHFINNELGRESGSESSLSSHVRGEPGWRCRFTASGRHSGPPLPCTLSHYHASWCAGLDISHEAVSECSFVN